MTNQKQKEKRIGEKNILFNGLVAEILEYRSAIDIDLLLSNGEIRRNMKYSEFLNGKVKSYFLPSVRSVGYIGEIETRIGNERCYETLSKLHHALEELSFPFLQETEGYVFLLHLSQLLSEAY